ncbi:MAG: hypothetical protein CM15mV24_0100 [Bellamyvirus sp.]|nr:MAG: hypothetical protein CM15mV24_0100 [Bellamyvirus sp.]
MRYVIPASSGGTVARPPVEGFILQESNTSIGSTNAEIQTYFGSGSIANINQQRNFRFIADATFSDGAKTASFVTELPHDLTVGSKVQINNVTSANNTTGAGNSGFNHTTIVTGISSTKMLLLDWELILVHLVMILLQEILHFLTLKRKNMMIHSMSIELRKHKSM